jgi:hypothetical protein
LLGNSNWHIITRGILQESALQGCNGVYSVRNGGNPLAASMYYLLD